MKCSHCGHESAEATRFCSNCGSRLVELAPDDDAERRPLTIMFVDLVGSTALSEQVDPEDYRDTVRSYYAICEDAIGRYDGYVVKYMGDGAMAYFGYPTAHAEDAQRAVLAAMEIARDVPHLERNLGLSGDNGLNVRIGIHSGSTIVGEVGAGAAQEALAVGDIPNVASRLEAAAPVGGIVVSDTTRELVGDDFELEDLGPQELKGVSEPVPAFRVVRAVERRRTSLARGRMVGRQAEIERVSSAIEALVNGAETTMLVEGDAGMGKSRLLALAEEASESAGVEWLVAACSPFQTNSFLHPFIGLISALAGIGSDDGPEDQLAKLQQLLTETGLGRQDALPLLASLISIPGGGSLEYSPEVRKQRTLEVIVELARGGAAESPRVLVVEDVHWADPSTLELLAGMAESPSDVHLLLLITARSGTPAADLDLGPRGARLSLHPLTAGEVADLVQELAGDSALSDDSIAEIAARSDGVPLYVEELVKAAINVPERSRPRADEPTVPATLRGLLAAQLDQLGLGKRLVQNASLLGHEFPADLLRAVLPESVDVSDGLEQLQQADIVVPVGAGVEGVYEFRHEMLREAAYESLLNKTRRRLHERVARAYEDQYPGEVAVNPELVAHHWERAGHDAPAAEYYLRAGQRSEEIFANLEALSFYDSAVAALGRVTVADVDGGDGVLAREQHMLDQFRAMELKGELLARMRRQEEAAATFEAALDLTANPIAAASLHRRIGKVYEQERDRALQAFDEADASLQGTEQSAERSLEWLNIQIARLKMHYWYDDADQMMELVEQVGPLVEESGTPPQRAEYYQQLTLTDFRRDRYWISPSTMDHVREYVKATELTDDLSELAEARFTLSFCLLFALRPKEALDELRGALDLAERTGNRAIEVRCLSYIATAHRLAGNEHEAADSAQRARVEAEAEGMIEYVALADANLAWSFGRQGEFDRERALAEQAAASWTSMEMVWPFRWLGLLPLLAVAVEEEDSAAAIDLTRQLLDDTQQRLPEPVMDSLRRLAELSNTGDAGDAVALARDVLEVSAAAGLG